MHSTRKAEKTKKSSRTQPVRQRQGILPTPEHQAQVARVHKFLELASNSPPVSGPPVFRQTPAGTLEQVGKEADNAWAGVKKIFQLLNTEGKVYDSQTAGACSWAGGLVNLTTGITQGSGDSQRNGDSMKITRIRGKIALVWGTTDTAITFVVGRSKDGVPALADVFETVGNAYSQLTFENHDQRKVDQWLWHKTEYLNIVDTKTAYYAFDLKNLEVPTTYVNGAATVSSGCYWFGIISGAAVAGSYQANIRVNFVDN